VARRNAVGEMTTVLGQDERVDRARRRNLAHRGRERRDAQHAAALQLHRRIVVMQRRRHILFPQLSMLAVVVRSAGVLMMGMARVLVRCAHRCVVIRECDGRTFVEQAMLGETRMAERKGRAWRQHAGEIHESEQSPREQPARSRKADEHQSHVAANEAVTIAAIGGAAKAVVMRFTRSLS
jgi:hypothetical protein